MTGISLDRVGKRFGGVVAVDDLSLAIERPGLSGLIGPNGAGKTTVVNLVTGIVRVSGGAITIDGRDVTNASPEAIARQGIARTFQNIRLLRDASVIDNVIVGFHRHETHVVCRQSPGSAFRLA